MIILMLLTDWVNQKQTRPPTLLFNSSLEEPETLFIKKGGNWKVMLQENLPLNVFSSIRTLQKEINIYFPWPMKKEKNLTGNTFGPTMEEFFSDKAMTAESLLSEVKRTFNISKNLWTTLEIPTKFLNLNQFENSPMIETLIPYVWYGEWSTCHFTCSVSWTWCISPFIQ